MKKLLTTVAAAALLATFGLAGTAVAQGSYGPPAATAQSGYDSLVVQVRHDEDRYEDSRYDNDDDRDDRRDRRHRRDHCDFGHNDNDNEAVGTVAGAIIGGVIGNQIGNGDGGSTLAGVILGGVIGNRIGANSDDDDRCDSHYVRSTYYSTFERGREGRRYNWRNPHSGNYGYVRLEGSRRIRGQRCREFEQTIFIDGDRETATGVACRQRNGDWRIVS